MKKKNWGILEYRCNRDKTIFDKLISLTKRKTQEKIKTNKQTIIFLFCEIIYPNFSSLFECPCPNLLFNNIPLTHLQPKIPPLPHQLQHPLPNSLTPSLPSSIISSRAEVWIFSLLHCYMYRESAKHFFLHKASNLPPP